MLDTHRYISRYLLSTRYLEVSCIAPVLPDFSRTDFFLLLSSRAAAVAIVEVEGRDFCDHDATAFL